MRAPAVKVSTSAGTCKPAGVFGGELERRGSAGGAVWDMPAHAGESAIAEFFATVPAGGALDRIRLVPTRPNRQPAVAAYVQDAKDGGFTAYGLMALSLDGEAIAEITGFADPTLFPPFGLTDRLTG